MFKLPSLAYIATNARDTFRRFPYVLACAFLSAGLSISLIENDSSDDGLTKLMMAFMLGISVFFSLTLYLERPHRIFKPSRPLLLIAGALFLTGFHFLSGTELTEDFYLHYAQWALVFHLLASFAPFTGKGEMNGFWQFNRILFLRFCLSTLYAIVFGTGLALALGALDNLLGIKIHDKLYADLWVVAGFVLQTWHFLAGVPKDFSKLERVKEYPKALKIFVQYLLIPLMTLYVFILYLYMGKILIHWNWPRGIVTWLVSALSVFGVFTLLLVHPVQEQKENKWIKVYARVFYYALFPLLVMLLVSAGKRIGQYGITEQRYFVVVLALWISGIALYFLLRAKPHIKVVPVSLCLIALFTSFGPWGGYSVSVQSQLSRLKGFLAKNDLMEKGKAKKVVVTPLPTPIAGKAPAVSAKPSATTLASPDKPVVSKVSWEDRREISSILDYLIANHGVGSVQPLFDVDLSQWKTDASEARYFATRATADLMKSMGLAYVERWESKDEKKNEIFLFSTVNWERPLSVEGYDTMLEILTWRDKKFTLEGRSYLLRVTGDRLELLENDKLALQFPLKDLLTRLEARHSSYHYNIPIEEMVMEARGPRLKGRLNLTQINGTRKGEQIPYLSVSGYLLLAKSKK